MKPANSNHVSAKLTACNPHDIWPQCPHCGSDDMYLATLTLEQLLGGFPFAPWRNAGPDGYAHDVGCHDVVVDCPECFKPSILLIDGNTIKLLAARTELDDRYLDQVTLR